MQGYGACDPCGSLSCVLLVQVGENIFLYYEALVRRRFAENRIVQLSSVFPIMGKDVCNNKDVVGISR